MKDDINIDYISNLYEDSVQDRLSEEQLKSIYQACKNRYEQKIPPGYEDNKKPFPRLYSDLVIWNELMLLSKIN